MKSTGERKPTKDEKEKIETIEKDFGVSEFEENGAENETEFVAESKREENQSLKTRRERRKSLILAGVIALCSFGAGMLTRQLMLDSELVSLMRLKNRVQKSYYTEISDEEFYGVLFGAVNEKLLDQYSRYMTADEYLQTQTESKGEHSGIGLTFSTLDKDGNERLLVVKVGGNSPAESVGICAGDSVIGVGKTSDSVQPCATFDELEKFLSGYKTGEKFYLQLQKQGVVELSKQIYVENYVFYRTQDCAYRFTGETAETFSSYNGAISGLPTDTAYIKLTQFNGGASAQFDVAMRTFKEQGKKNLVLDLRGNGGGYLDIMREIARYFCKNTAEKKPIVAIAHYGDKKEYFRATGNIYSSFFQEDSRICVLADDSSASASECLLGCMMDYGTISYGDICLSERNGVAKTYGKGIMQTTYRLGLISGDAVKLTTAKICWPVSENCIHGVGILPKDGTKTVQESYQADEELLAALQALFP